MIKKDELHKYIESGPHGVTKHQMIPAIETHCKNRDVIIALYKHFRNTFKTSLRYCKKASRLAVQDILGEDVSRCSQEELALINALGPKRKGISMHQIIHGVENAVEAGNFERISQIQKYFPEFYMRAKRYIKKPTLEKIRAFKAVSKATAAANRVMPVMT